jgi:hypothetical protein
MAVRYGMGRHTYANSDAAALCRRIWGLFTDQQQDQIRGDVASIFPQDSRVEPWQWVWGAQLRQPNSQLNQTLEDA